MSLSMVCVGWSGRWDDLGRGADYPGSNFPHPYEIEIIHIKGFTMRFTNLSVLLIAAVYVFSCAGIEEL